jgi:aspartyl-tRNA(Asn)/glutamyl-tRNA(Gln) amidotransferase subunit C
MPDVSENEVRHVAKLARLDLSNEELERVRVELNRIMGHFNELQELDTADVPPTSHAIPMANVSRPDVAVESLPVDQVVANAPDSVDGYFRTSLFME